MQSQFEQAERYLRIVAALNHGLGWGLRSEMIQAYADALEQNAAADCADALLQRIATNYHYDHATVQALLRAGSVSSPAAWETWMDGVVPILRGAGLGWSSDAAVDADDLAQVARAALAEALPRFRYASRLSTWAYQVVVQSVKRYLRDQGRLKRAVRPESLDQLTLPDPVLPDAEHPEAVVDARQLAALIDAVLAAEEDRRLAHIFRLWAQGDLRAEEIGRQVGLSPSRVRVLIQYICRTLQESPDIQAWIAAQE